MIDEYSGLEIRKTTNGMVATDDEGIPIPPQHRGLLELREEGLPVDFEQLVPVNEVH